MKQPKVVCPRTARFLVKALVDISDGCRRCEISALACKHAFYRGQVPADIVFVGEGPGKTEDVMGQPFVGASGRLLDKWIAYAHRVRDFRFAITNLLACRATDSIGGDNRKPTTEEIVNCRQRLLDFLLYTQPVGIVRLGRVAQENLPTDLPVLDLFHPAYVLRCGGVKSPESEQAQRNLRRFVCQRKLR